MAEDDVDTEHAVRRAFFPLVAARRKLYGPPLPLQRRIFAEGPRLLVAEGRLSSRASARRYFLPSSSCTATGSRPGSLSLDTQPRGGFPTSSAWNETWIGGAADTATGERRSRSTAARHTRRHDRGRLAPLSPMGSIRSLMSLPTKSIVRRDGERKSLVRLRRASLRSKPAKPEAGSIFCH